MAESVVGGEAQAQRLLRGRVNVMPFPGVSVAQLVQASQF
jgi:hypothetical protein